jgi:peptide/nickel transport system permease protein
MDYISASKTLGTRNIVIIFREMLPNLVDIGVANFVLTMAANIGIETGLSLLGFGLGWNWPSLGVMINRATIPDNLQNFWWVWLPALVLVCVIMLCVNYVGNALQRVADPKQRLV